jgi:hypothetical protein
MRGPLATLAGVVAVAVLLPLSVAGLRPAVEAPPPAPAITEPPPSDPLALSDTDDGTELLREQIGGLAALVLPADPLVRACAAPVPAPGPEETGVDGVVGATERLRGLSLDEGVDVRLVDHAEMVREVEERFASRADPDRTDVEGRILTALGAIDPGTDLAGLRLDAFAEQVSGMYAGADRLVLVRVEEPGWLSPLEQVVLAHELEHALTHQHLGRPRGQAGDRDARLASLALVEGSATLLMVQYARTALDEVERDRLHDALLARASGSALAGYTPYLLAELRFPYQDGLRFVCARWLEGGWEAVDAAYDEPPVSSAEILFPDRYGQAPRSPDHLGDLRPPWTQAHTSTFGAAELLWLLEAPGGDPGAGPPDARERVSAWDGGVLELWVHGDEQALGLAVAEREDDRARPRLCATLGDWYEAAFPDAVRTAAENGAAFSGATQHAKLACPAGEARLGIGPTPDVAAALVRRPGDEIHQN